MDKKEKILKLKIWQLIIIIILVALISLLVGANTQIGDLFKLHDKIGDKYSDADEEDDVYYDDDIEDYLYEIGLNNRMDLPVFSNINEADKEWLWENVRNYLEEEEEFEYDEIQNAINTIYGNDLNLDLSEIEKYGIILNQETGKYNVDYYYEYQSDDEDEDEDDEDDDCEIGYEIKNVETNDNEVKIEMVQYKTIDVLNEDDDIKSIKLYDINDKLVKTYKVTTYEQNVDNYFNQLEAIQKNVKSWDSNVIITLKINDDGTYNVVSILKQ